MLSPKVETAQQQILKASSVSNVEIIYENALI